MLAGKRFISFNTASGMDCMQFVRIVVVDFLDVVSIPQAVWIACNAPNGRADDEGIPVSIPQAVWIACNNCPEYQFPKRLEVSIPQAVWIACNFRHREESSPLLSFQYRKRYGLHAIIQVDYFWFPLKGFNTASGMDCMQ